MANNRLTPIKLIKIILFFVLSFLLVSSDAQGELQRIRVNVFESSFDDVLSSVNKIPTTDLLTGTVVEFFGRNKVGDGGAGLAIWNGSAWVKSFNDNVSIVSKLQSRDQEDDGLELVDLAFTSTDFPYEILYSNDMSHWTSVSPIALNSSNGMTIATLQIPPGFVRMGIEVPVRNFIHGYSPGINQQAFLADHWAQEISATPLFPPSLFTSEAYADQVANGCGPFSKASHLYTMDETSGSFVDLIGDADVPTSGLISQVFPANGRFQSARYFNGTDSYGIGTKISKRGGRPFWFSIGLNFDSVSGNAGILSESSGSLGAISAGEWGWAFWRIGTKIELRVRRYKRASHADSVAIQGITANKNYIITGRSDGVTLHLYLHGDGETKESHEHASLISSASGVLDPSPFPLNIGWAPLSSNNSSNVMNGEIGFVAHGFGQIAEALVDEIDFSRVNDFEGLNKKVDIKMARFNKIYGLGDSLTTESFSITSWPERVALLKGPAWTFEASGIGGQTSTPIVDRYLSYPSSNTAARVVAPWFGNNDPGNRQLVIDNYERVIQRALADGAERVILLGLINRSGYDSLQTTIDTLQGHHDFINDGLAQLASSNPQVYYADLKSRFQNPENYTDYTLTADDFSDIDKGIVPRGMRDDPASPSSTHLGPLGSSHLASFIYTFLPE